MRGCFSTIVRVIAVVLLTGALLASSRMPVASEEPVDSTQVEMPVEEPSDAMAVGATEGVADPNV